MSSRFVYVSLLPVNPWLTTINATTFRCNCSVIGIWLIRHCKSNSSEHWIEWDFSSNKEESVEESVEDKIIFEEVKTTEEEEERWELSFTELVNINDERQ